MTTIKVQTRKTQGW